MPVDQKNIESYLEGAARAERFDPYWLVTGNDEFLMLETGDKIRAAAFAAGHTERIVLELGAKSDWTTLVEAATSYGMFDDKKIVEVRLAGAPGLKGGPVLKDLLSRVYDGVSVVFFVPTPDWSAAKAPWWTELKKQSTVVECNTPERRNLPAWLGARQPLCGASGSRKARASLPRARTHEGRGRIGRSQRLALRDGGASLGHLHGRARPRGAHRRRARSAGGTPRSDPHFSFHANPHAHQTAKRV